MEIDIDISNNNKDNSVVWMNARSIIIYNVNWERNQRTDQKEKETNRPLGTSWAVGW